MIVVGNRLWCKTHLLKRHMLRGFQCVPKRYVTENYFEIHLPSIMSIVWIAPLKHLKLPISHYTANCAYLQDSFISKFDFMNCRCIFANLVVVWLNINFSEKYLLVIATPKTKFCAFYEIKIILSFYLLVDRWQLNAPFCQGVKINLDEMPHFVAYNQNLHCL